MCSGNGTNFENIVTNPVCNTNETVKYENNSMIIFPSWAKHGVNKVSHEGRYCVTVGLIVTNK